jgi:GGDEF domain-containing protein
MINSDKFKQGNDTHGHVVGDDVLKQLGEIIRSSVRENDLVCYVVERIRSTTEAAVFEPGTIDLKLTLSFGIETCPEAP